MSNVPAWLLVVTGLGGGAVGTIITTYGTQTYQRREARAAGRETLRYAEDLAYVQSEHKDIKATLARLETSAMLAGLPRKLTELHREGRMRHWVLTMVPVTGDQEAITQHKSDQIVNGSVAH
jgi:hypothetical protein